MTAPKTVADAIRNLALIRAAWDIWAKQEPSSGTPDEGAAWDAGYAAFELANSEASDAVEETRCASLSEVVVKLAWLRDDAANFLDEGWRERLAYLHQDLARLLSRPTQDAFAVKLRAYQRAMKAIDEGKAAGADDAVMGPLYGAAYDCGKAVLLEPAPDAAAMVEKREVFDALQYDEDTDAPAVTHRLFADAIALAGGAA